MSIVVRFHPSNATKEKYDESIRRLKETGEFPAQGMELHVAFGPEDNMRVSEVWDSREQLQAFGETLMPILTDIGIEFSGEPEIIEAIATADYDQPIGRSRPVGPPTQAPAAPPVADIATRLRRALRS